VSIELKGGYAGTVLRIDLASKKIWTESLDPAFARAYVGGRGFTSRLGYDLVPRTSDPLGPDNVVVLAVGPLTGTSAPSSGRFTVGARSPLTGVFGDANAGGFCGAVLKRAGYDIVIIEGRSPQPVYLWIDDDQVEIRDARHMWGKDVNETTEMVREETARGTRVAAIGQGGENLVRFAALMVDIDHAAGRSGMGAVMGSKRLKAIAVRGTRRVALYDRGRFKELVDEFDQILRTDSRSGGELLEFGTTALVDHHTAAGCMNVRNYNGGVYERKEKIDGAALNAQYLVRADGCYRCTCKCDRYSRVEEGEFAGTEVGGPEYGTLAAFGSGCDNDNLASILKANELCNRYGLDTIETGNVIAFVMELYEHGILAEPLADGLDLSWGNYHAILDLVDRIAFRRGLGDVLADGVVPAAEKIGSGAERYAVHVKGMTPPGPDARALKVYNFRYAVSPRGCDHLRISAPGAYSLDHLPILEAATELRKWENIVTIPDLMGTCKFPYSYYAETIERTMYKMLELLPEMYNAATGLAITADDLLEAAERVVNVERAYNTRLGLTSEHDTLPPRWTEDPLPSGPKSGAVYDILEPMKEAWYKIHGWDTATGRPRREKLVKLQLDDIAEDLEQHGIPLT